MPDVIPLKTWYPAMADQWIDRLATLERQGVKVVYEPNERRGWVIHHTVGGAATDPRVYARQVADSHWNKWLRPGGYNFLVGTDGRIREMSGLLHVGAHSGTHEWNRATLGIAFQGDFRQRAPSDSMLNAAREFMASVPVSEDQWTHREVRPEPTTCPGNALIDLLPLEVDDMKKPLESWARDAFAWAIKKGFYTNADTVEDVREADEMQRTIVFLHRYHRKVVVRAISAGGVTASAVIAEIVARLS